jgi:lactoylglutathione lyase
MSAVRYRISLLTVIAIVLLVCPPLFAQDASPARPKITGISHVGYFVSDLPQAIAFWHDFLGFDEEYSLTKKDSTDIRIAFIKINDHQHIELFNEPPTHPPNMMSHLCFTVDDIEAMHRRLRL